MIISKCPSKFDRLYEIVNLRPGKLIYQKLHERCPNDEEHITGVADLLRCC